MSMNFWDRTLVTGLRAKMGAYLPMRSDLAQPLISALNESMSVGFSELQRINFTIGRSFLRSPQYKTEMFPSDPYYGRKEDADVKRFDDQLYAQFVEKHLSEELFVFKASDLESNPARNGDFLQDLLEIFLYDSKKLVLERPKSSVIRLASRPNVVSRFFTSNSTGDTEFLLFPAEVIDVEVYRDHIQIYFNGDENIGIYKERIYR